MKIGLVGKPNVGKSTFFAAATLVDAQIGNYPFTTIDANTGVGAVRVQDPGQEMGVVSTPRHGVVIGETRRVPVQLVDVAGLVPGAHTGKGLGNKFLGDLSQADVLLHIVDASGSADAEGNPGEIGSHDPLQDVAFLEAEIDHWIDSIMADGWAKLVRRVQQENRKLPAALVERLAGIQVTEPAAVAALRAAGLLNLKPAEITDEQRFQLAQEIRRASKPIIVVLNKADLVDPERIETLKGEIEGPCFVASAQSELALRKGAEAGLISYTPGASTFEAAGALNPAQQEGMKYIREHVLARFGSTGVQQALDSAVFDVLGLLPAFPVEDETKLTDKEGRVLPDCHLVTPGTTAKGLAYKVHTDLGDHFIRGIDCRTKRAIGADYEVAAGDIIKIGAAA